MKVKQINLECELKIDVHEMSEVTKRLMVDSIELSLTGRFSMCIKMMWATTRTLNCYVGVFELWCFD